MKQITFTALTLMVEQQKRRAAFKKVMFQQIQRVHFCEPSLIWSNSTKTG